jgi:hypothetical protein
MMTIFHRLSGMRMSGLWRVRVPNSLKQTSRRNGRVGQRWHWMEPLSSP